MVLELSVRSSDGITSSAVVPGASRGTRPSGVSQSQPSVQEVAGPASQEDQDQSEEAPLGTPGWRSGSATNCLTVTLTNSARELLAGVSTPGKYEH